jgi:hypothetical protein
MLGPHSCVGEDWSRHGVRSQRTWFIKDSFFFIYGSTAIDILDTLCNFLFLWLDSPIWAWASSFRRGFIITHIWDTPQSVGLLWTRDQPVAETSTWQHTTLTRDRSMPPVGFFFAFPGFFPFDPFLYCLNPIVLHVTLRSMLPSLLQTQHKHPCPRWDSKPQSQ